MAGYARIVILRRVPRLQPLRDAAAVFASNAERSSYAAATLDIDGPETAGGVAVLNARRAQAYTAAMLSISGYRLVLFAGRHHYFTPVIKSVRGVGLI